MKPRVLALLLLAAWLNLWGVAWGAPDPAYSQTALASGGSHPQALVHPDAFHFAERSFYMAATGDWNPHFFENPSLYINLNLLLHLLSGAAADQPVAPEGAYVMREFAPFPPYVMGRVVSALAGVLFVAFTYALGRRLFGARAGELGALLAALSPVVVQHSHYATTNVTAAALATGALWASVRLLRERAPAATTAYLAAGLLVGLAGSAKYNAVLAGVVYVLVGLIGVRRSYVEAGQSRALRAWRPFLLGLAAVGAGFLLGTPYALLDARTFLQDVVYITTQYVGGQGYPESDHALAFHMAHIAWFGLGLPGVVFAGVGVAASVRARRPLTQNSAALGAALLLSYIGVYALVVLRARRLGDHLTLPLIGALAALAGAGAAWALERAGGRRSATLRVARPLGRAVALGVVPLLAAMPLAYAINFDALLSRPDTRELAQRWVAEHVRRGEPVHLVGPYNVPLDPADYPTTQDFGHTYQPPDALREQAVGLAVVSDAVNFLFDGAEPLIPSPLPAQVRAALAAYDDAMTWVLRVERPRWWGDSWPLSTAAYFHNPTIRVYCFPDVCADVIAP